jgi:hypothetical protein
LQAAEKRFPAVILSLFAVILSEAKDLCICWTSQILGFFAQFTLSEMKRILRYAQDDRRSR